VSVPDVGDLPPDLLAPPPPYQSIATNHNNHKQLVHTTHHSIIPLLAKTAGPSPLPVRIRYNCGAAQVSLDVRNCIVEGWLAADVVPAEQPQVDWRRFSSAR